MLSHSVQRVDIDNLLFLHMTWAVHLLQVYSHPVGFSLQNGMGVSSLVLLCHD
jgi:hypothetical protein